MPEEDDAYLNSVTEDAGAAGAAGEDEFVSPQQDSDNPANLLGEFEADSEEDIHFATAVSDRVRALPVSARMQSLLEARIRPLVRLEALEAERQELLAKDGLEESVKMQLSMQVAEARSMPELAAVQEKKAALEAKIHKVRAQAAPVEGEGHPAPSVRISTDQERAWELGLRQYALLLERGQALPEIVQYTQEYLKTEPLYQLLNSVRYPAQLLFGLAVYQLGLENWSQRAQSARKEVQRQLAESGEGSKRLFARVTKEEGELRQRLDKQIEQHTLLINCIAREIAGLQKTLSAEFWRAYEFCACMLVSGKFAENRQVVLRAFIRYGLMGHAPWFVCPDVQRYIVGDCMGSVKLEFDTAMSAGHILYADEFIRFIVEGYLAPSIDENLELTARNSPEWNADKAMRRLAYSRVRAAALRERRLDMVDHIARLRAEQDQLQLARDKLIKNAKDYKQRNAELAQGVQHCKVEAARFERIVQRIDEKEIPDLKERETMARDRLEHSGVSQTAFQLARKEAGAIHRVCRLCAKLKDPFLPFVLRDNFRLEAGVVNARKEIEKRLKAVEVYDRNIFNETMVNSRKESQRIYLRFHPVFLITPSCGFLGYSWNPRVGVETGKLVLPGYCPRAGLIDRMLYNMLADFRWDTSKAAAGVDVLTSDTLAAAYSAVRWDYRKRKRENREKALIFNEVNDRTNWRRHYELYLMSALDAGRKLFFKNPEVYEVILRYIGLPEGQERMRR